MKKSVLLGLITGMMMSTAWAQQNTMDLPISDDSTPPPAVSMPKPAPKPVSRRSDDCTVLKGALVASAALSTSFSATGDSDMWMNLFTVKRDIGNAVAEDMASRIVPLLKNSANKRDLRAIAEQMASAQQSGDGDAQYWADAFQTQADVFSSAASSLTILVHTACH